MARFFYAALRHCYPNCEIVLLASKAFQPIEWKSFFSKGIYFEREDLKKLSGFISLVRILRRERFDLAFGMPFSVSSALLLRMSGARAQVAFAEKSAGWLLTDPVEWLGRAGGKHKSLLYLDLIDSCPKRFPGACGCRLQVGASDAVVQASPITIRRIVMAPGASVMLRQWPYFGQLALALKRMYRQLEIVLVGSSAEQYWSDRFRTLGVGVDDRIGRTSLADVISLCSGSVLVIANDSGIAHLSASIALAPTLVIYGPGDPDYIRPIGPRVYEVALDNLRCRPCESARCHGQFGHKACLNALDVSVVLKAASCAIERSLETARF